jgi:hypothetical protein
MPSASVAEGILWEEKACESGNPRNPLAKYRVGGDDEHATDCELYHSEGNVDPATWPANPHAPGLADGLGDGCRHGGRIALVLVTPGNLAH